MRVAPGTEEATPATARAGDRLPHPNFAARSAFRAAFPVARLAVRVAQDESDKMEPIQAQQPTSDGDVRVGVLSAVSNEMVRLYKEQFGRGPTRARTNWAGSDTLVCLLEDTLTPAERNLARMGEHQRLRDTRMFFQYATVSEFCEPVERITGRTVRSFQSSVDTKVDGMSCELFVFHPEGSDAPSRTELGDG